MNDMYPQLDLEKEGYAIGQIICIDGHRHNPKRVIFSERFGCFALQNKGGERGSEWEHFGDFTEHDGKGLRGSLDDCFTLPLHAKNKITVLGFQEVPEKGRKVIAS